MAGKSSTKSKSKPRGGTRGGWSFMPGPEEIFELEVVLAGSKPRIWRRFEVSSRCTLDDLHNVLQLVMGWQNCHLHEFRTKDDRRFSPPMPDGYDVDEGAGNSAAIALSALKKEMTQGLTYEYDFGDGWTHLIKLKKTRPMESRHKPKCLAGENACPPEDCGGLYGYYDMLEAVKDPKHEMHAEYLEWLDEGFDPAAFDKGRVNKALAKCCR